MLSFKNFTHTLIGTAAIVHLNSSPASADSLRGRQQQQQQRELDGTDSDFDFNITTLDIYEDPLAHEGTVILDDGILFVSNHLYEIDPTTKSGQGQIFGQVSFYNFT